MEKCLESEAELEKDKNDSQSAYNPLLPFKRGKIGKHGTGRSMLEILVVLSIISVLSLAFLFGYKLAINHNLANNILNDVRLMAASILHREQTYQVGEDIPVQDYKGDTMYVKSAYQATGKSFSVQAFDVPFNVCKLILQKAAKVYTITVEDFANNLTFFDGKDETICADQGTAYMQFFFEKGSDFKAATDICEAPCPSDVACKNGICFYPCGACENQDSETAECTSFLQPCEKCEDGKAVSVLTGCQKCENGEAVSALKECEICENDKIVSIQGECEICEGGVPVKDLTTQECCTFHNLSWVNGVCCQKDEEETNGHCCPKGSQYATEEGKCCENGQVESEGHCCPTGWAFSNVSNGVCCPQRIDLTTNTTYPGDGWCWYEHFVIANFRNTCGYYVYIGAGSICDDVAEFYVDGVSAGGVAGGDTLYYANGIPVLGYPNNTYAGFCPANKDCSLHAVDGAGQICGFSGSAYLILRQENLKEKECPAGQIFDVNGRVCRECSYTGAIQTLLNMNNSCDNPKRYFANNNYSYVCEGALSQYVATTKENCLHCGDGVRFWRDYDDLCLDCSIENTTKVTKEECEACPNRMYWYYDDGCLLCPNGTKRDSNGGCECPEGQVFDVNGFVCRECSYTGAIATSKQASQSCADNKRYFSDSNWSWTSYTCDKSVASSQAGHVLTPDDCHWCGAGVRFWRNNQQCISCDYPADIDVTTKAECEACPNRMFYGTDENNGTCLLCPNETQRGSDGNCQCPAGQIFDVNGRVCRECSYTGAIQTLLNMNNSCDNPKRYFANNNYSYVCEGALSQYVATTKENCLHCGDGVRFWRDYDDLCLDCSIENTTKVTKEECEACPNRMYWYYDDGCLLCPNGTKRDSNGGCECPEGQVFDVNGFVCRECSYTGAIATSKQASQSCADNKRYFSDSNWSWTSYTCDKSVASSQAGHVLTPDDCHWCGAGVRFWRNNQQCISCDYPADIDVTTKAECESCPNRTFVGTDVLNGICKKNP